MKIQESKTPIFSQDFVDVKSFGFLDYWVFEFWDFTVVFLICRNSSKIGFGKKAAFGSVFTVVLGGVRVVGGAFMSIYVYTCIMLCICMFIIHICVCICIYVYTDVCM